MGWKKGCQKPRDPRAVPRAPGQPNKSIEQSGGAWAAVEEAHWAWHRAAEKKVCVGDSYDALFEAERRAAWAAATVADADAAADAAAAMTQNDADGVGIAAVAAPGCPTVVQRWYSTV